MKQARQCTPARLRAILVPISGGPRPFTRNQIRCSVHSVSIGIFGSVLGDERLTTRACL